MVKTGYLLPPQRMHCTRAGIISQLDMRRRAVVLLRAARCQQPGDAVDGEAQPPAKAPRMGSGSDEKKTISSLRQGFMPIPITRRDMINFGIPEPQRSAVISLVRRKLQNQTDKLMATYVDLVEKNQQLSEKLIEASGELANRSSELGVRGEELAESKWQARTRLEIISVLQGKIDLRGKISLVEGEVRIAYEMGRGSSRLAVWTRAFMEKPKLLSCVSDHNPDIKTPERAAKNLERIIDNLNVHFHPKQAQAQARAETTLIIESDALPRADCLVLDCFFEAYNVERELKLQPNLDDDPDFSLQVQPPSVG